MIVLFRADTGEPLAVMDGRLITELRTAAVSAVATKLAVAPVNDSRRSSAAECRRVRMFVRLRWCGSSTRSEFGAATPTPMFAGELGATAMSAEEAVRGADVVMTVQLAAPSSTGCG